MSDPRRATAPYGLVRLAEAPVPATALHPDHDTVAAFLEQLPSDHAGVAALASRHDDKLAPDRTVTQPTITSPVRHAFEPRHPSFGEPAALRLLRDHGVALVAGDSRGASGLANSLVSKSRPEDRPWKAWVGLAKQ